MIININFFLLLLTMILYWLQSSFFLPTIFRSLPNFLSQICSILQASFLIVRWSSSGHFPLSNLYESLLFLSWCLTTILVVLTLDIRSNKSFSLFQWKLVPEHPNKMSALIDFVSSLVGSIMTPVILLINTFAVFSLPVDLKASSALVPALQSNWLVMHVTVMILSYGTLLAGCLFSIAYLILTLYVAPKVKQPEVKQPVISPALLPPLTHTLSMAEVESMIQDQIDPLPNEIDPISRLAARFDNLSYRILGLGFPLLTIGLLSGAVWANQTWGSYWSWDPKETWALITWFIFAIYLHTRISKGWSGRESALLAVVGFIVLWVCYLGVNLMGNGLHSYGFLS